jgi:hypothetical protein
MLSHTHPKQTNMAQHRRMGKNNTFPKPAATAKQPKSKKQMHPQLNLGWDTEILPIPTKKETD